ncbi:MAG: hypothetical protein ACFFBY_14630 [Promethearchaeota archaeon]
MSIIFKQININTILSPLDKNNLAKKIGIDVGQSLTKIAFLEKESLILSIGATKNNFHQIMKLIETFKLNLNQINFTGGKAFDLFKKYENSYHCNLIDEFEANVKGLDITFRYKRNKPLPPSLIITIGTGTSFVLKNKTIKHIGGTALGGGFFMGIIKILFNIDDYQKAITLSKKGNRYNLDLRVKDIYNAQDDRVDIWFREFTASSLGKIDQDTNLSSLKREDVLNSLVCLIGENIGSLASIYAKNYNIGTLIYCGGFLINNNPLATILKMICKINRQRLLIVENSEFNGAIGALLF